MNRRRILKRELKRDYSFKRFLSDREIKNLKADVPKYFAERVAAMLVVGCVKIEAVLYKSNKGLMLGYDVFVKDDINSPEWICFDSPVVEVILKEKEMFLVLEKVVHKNHLSYTDCCFESINGKQVFVRNRKSKHGSKK